MQWLKDIINWLCQPSVLFTVATVGFLIAVRMRVLWTKASLYGGTAIVSIFFVWSLFDVNFSLIVSKPDNVPITAMLFLVPFFLWLGMYLAYENDRRIAAGDGPMEGGDGKDRMLVWPDLVYIELLALILCTVVLVVWWLYQVRTEPPFSPGGIGSTLVEWGIVLAVLFALNGWMVRRLRQHDQVE